MPGSSDQGGTAVIHLKCEDPTDSLTLHWRSVLAPGYDPILLEIFRSLYAAVAEEMGVTLRRTAFSPNIKERRDYSCAVFDANGELVAQGDHMPVHLGSMPMSVAAAVRAVSMVPGDIVVLNDPFEGGTHLPDLTLVSPVFDPGSGRLLFHVANRAHHSDIGGITPGSMPLSTISSRKDCASPR